MYIYSPLLSVFGKYAKREGGRDGGREGPPTLCEEVSSS